VLFNPGMRHEQEEKLAKQMLREDEGTGRKGRLGIDLESGVVVIGSGAVRPGEASPQAAAAAAPAGDEAGSAPRPVTNDQGVADRPASPTHNGTRSVPHAPAAMPSGKAHSPAAVPSGKARRRSEPDTGRQKPTGKSRRRGR